ncbi:MAG: DUF4097 family beta strand repeat-containing protein [Oscillospiraceae bacterium]|jgi:DUF4097 and DUF4098 domain-containing protein YvlB|nr:DUF4097 family beta strand repeat-containing protein [Oscillospiraceae bacterium]
MDKTEFLAELRTQIATRAPEELRRTVSYFEEIIDDRIEDGMSETEAVATLETPAQIAESLAGIQTAHNPNSYDAAELHTINIRDLNCPVFIVPRSDSVYIEYHSHEKKRYDVDCSNGVLDVMAVSSMKWYDYIGFGRGNTTYRPFVLGVPESFCGRINIVTSNCDASVSDVKFSGGLNIKTSNAKMTFRNLKISGEISAHTSNGKVVAQFVECGLFDAENSNGRIEATHISCDTELSLATSNGRVEIQHIKAGKRIALHSSNGRIYGVIDDNMREFSVRSHTSNGSNSLPGDMPGGNKDLEVSTSNGSIEIRFAPN